MRSVLKFNGLKGHICLFAPSTALTAALILLSTIEAFEEREITTTDNPTAFLHTPDKSKEQTHLKFEGFCGREQSVVDIDPKIVGLCIHIDFKEETNPTKVFCTRI